jgi:hypothetical protein
MALKWWSAVPLKSVRSHHWGRNVVVCQIRLAQPLTEAGHRIRNCAGPPSRRADRLSADFAAGSLVRAA